MTAQDLQRILKLMSIQAADCSAARTGKQREDYKQEALSLLRMSDILELLIRKGDVE